MVDKVAYEFDPFELVGIPAPKGKKIEAKAAISEFILEEVLNYVGQGRSPVSGGKWKRGLSPEYKKQKAKYSSALFANMELHGDMLDALEVVQNPKGKLELRVKGREADKADGHNNHTGRSSLPPREFIPKEGQTFKKPILDGIKRIAQEFLDDAENSR